MRNRLTLLILLLLTAGILIWHFNSSPDLDNTDELRAVYTSDQSGWPAPNVEDSIEWQPLSALPNSPYRGVDSLSGLTELGKTLFFDPRLSSSNQISCSSCHDPSLGWSNGRPTAVGHNHNTGKRNAPTLLNVWAIEPLFWDGRTHTLAQQIIHPISNPIEMNQNQKQLPKKLSAIPGYNRLFAQAFNDSAVTVDRIGKALQQFQRTIVSRSSEFDRFMRGDEDALSDQALKGLHLFRTTGRCMNCHYGPFFTDMKFHNLGLHYYGRKYEDLGRYEVTGDPDDMGKFRTPTLRDVMYTRPWFHNGLFNNIEGVMNMYSNGMARPKPRGEMKDDPHYPVTSDLLVELNLTDEEKDALIAFMEAISDQPYRMPRPELPGR